MQNDDELVDAVAKALYATHGYICTDDDNMFDDFPWEKADDCLKEGHRREARAAIAVMREAGWTPPIFSHALTMGSAAYKVKLGPSGNLVYEPVDLYETEKPATSEGAG